MLAAMHYSWITGSTKEIEKTYLYHKLEAIRAVKDSISDPLSQDICVNLISALALAEVRRPPILLNPFPPG